MSFSDDVKAITGLFRTLIAAAVIGCLGYGGGYLYTHFSPHAKLRQTQQELVRARQALDGARQQAALQGEQIKELNDALQASQREVERLDVSVRLLKVDKRVAEILVTRQQHDQASGETLTDFHFRELDEAGIPIGEARSFRIAGDLLYLDFWVVKFDDHYVEQADIDRSASICLFRRLFGEFQEPADGYTIDDVGQPPDVYRSGDPSPFERRIWDDFWNIALDPQRAAVMGIRAAHGEAVAVKLRPNKLYRVTLRASDGLSIAPPQDLRYPQVDTT